MGRLGRLRGGLGPILEVKTGLRQQNCPCTGARSAFGRDVDIVQA